MIDEYYHYRLGTLEYRSLRFETEELPEEDTVEELAEEPAYEPEAEEFEEPEAEIYEQEEIVDEEQAEPEEAQIPLLSRRSSRLSPDTPSKQKFTLPGKRFSLEPFSIL